MSEPVLSPAEVDAALAEQGIAWERHDDELVTSVTLHDFAAALAFVNAVGAAAEAANHHPDIDIRWNTVTLVLTTHERRRPDRARSRPGRRHRPPAPAALAPDWSSRLEQRRPQAGDHLLGHADLCRVLGHRPVALPQVGEELDHVGRLGREHLVDRRR